MTPRDDRRYDIVMTKTARRGPYFIRRNLQHDDILLYYIVNIINSGVAQTGGLRVKTAVIMPKI